MAYVKMLSENMETEREEGEIVDELDDLSDVSSEEEFLLRQRLEILENYNTVLERKEAKRKSVGGGKSNKTKHSFWQDFAKVPNDKNDPKSQEMYRVIRTEKYLKKNKRPKQQKKEVVPVVSHRKKNTRSKKIEAVKVVSETSEDSEDDEYKNKRRKLAEAVTLNKNKVDRSTLKDRLAKIFTSIQNKSAESFIIQKNIILSGQSIKPAYENSVITKSEILLLNNKNTVENPVVLSDVIDIDDDVKMIENDSHDTLDAGVTEKNIDIPPVSSGESTDEALEIIEKDLHDTVDAGVTEKKIDIPPVCNGENSDEDLEHLRQVALKTKSSKINLAIPDVQNIVANKADSEDEDSDTEELRMICLRSALLKKAIEIKNKQKLQKRLSQHSLVHDDIIEQYNDYTNDNENNTDIENVDMEIGSDGDEKSKHGCDNIIIFNDFNGSNKKDISNLVKLTKEDELEEDEDLLRAKLLTSLSKNISNYVDINSLANTTSATQVSVKPKTKVIQKLNVPEQKKLIINLGESDSEGEHEATKNLTKMHMKLAEQTEFQQKLDQFLKSTRKEVENKTLPDVVQTEESLKQPQKFVPKAMKHLPKSEQIEYKKLVKRMAELEKIKQARQLSLNSITNTGSIDTLKPRNISVNTLEMSAKKLEEKIETSRKMIAKESTKMLKLKEEATKLSQRYKIVSNELRNITTAITLNKKEQRNVHNCLSKIRLHHQMLLKSSTLTQHFTVSAPSKITNTKVLNNKKQKENDPSIKEHKNPNLLKSFKVSVVNDLNKDTPANNPRLSVEFDVNSNTKVVKAQTSTKDRTVDLEETETHIEQFKDIQNQTVEKNKNQTEDGVKNYISPLEALGRTERSKNVKKSINDQTHIEQFNDIQNQTVEENKNETEDGVKDYISPLEALGRTERTKNVRKSINDHKVDGICVQTSHKGAAIWTEDPNGFLCPFEVGGTCRDTDCKFLHLQTQ